MNHFLIQQPGGFYYYFYYDRKTGSLSLQRYTKNGLCHHTITVLRKNVEPDFSCDMDCDGNIHVAFSTGDGYIHYGYFSQNTFRSFPILVAKNPNSHPKRICILAKVQPITIFYVVYHNEKQLLSMQKVDYAENAFSSPIAIDYLPHNKQNFSACQSEDGTLFLAYNYFIRTLTSEGNTTDLKKILNTNENALYIDHFNIDKENNLTLLSHTLSYSSLYFYCSSKDFLQTIDLSPYPRSQKTFFGLAEAEEKKHCYFCTDGVLYDSIQNDTTLQLSPFQRKTKPYSGPVFPIYCITNKKCLLLPGTVTGRHIKTPRDVVGWNFDT